MEKEKPEDRILNILKKNPKKKYSFSTLFNEVRKQKQIQYDVFKNKLKKLSDEGKIILWEKRVETFEGKSLLIESEVKLVKGIVK